jgi:hypothetical protein
MVAGRWGLEDLGAGDVAKFDKLWRVKIVERLAADGHARPWNEGKATSDFMEQFRLSADKDGQIGAAYSTACFLLLLKPAGTRPAPLPDTPTESNSGKKR